MYTRNADRLILFWRIRLCQSSPSTRHTIYYQQRPVHEARLVSLFARKKDFRLVTIHTL
jgi:hypothetical protein